ncbi:MAG: nucleotidyltransferase family protein [Bacteroidetes bacterium]|nr:nucleotidyltransferase family protein [Bacteroidota bacterium]
MPEPDSNIAILLLAAGSSTRMEQPKQLLKFRDKTLLEHVVAEALSTSCRPVVVVLGAWFHEIQPAIAHLPVQIVRNINWEDGMSSTIACGMAYLLKNHPDTAAILLLLCDQPFVDAGILNELVKKWQTSGQPIVAAAYDGTFGVPALFDRSCFEELSELSGRQGAKSLMTAHPGEVATVYFRDGSIDLDTPEDYKRLLAAI